MTVWEALADPVRREILTVLRDGEATAGAIAARFAISRPAVSRHLRVLRESGLADADVRGQERVYRLAAGPLAEVEAWLRRVAPQRRQSPADRLDALGTELRRGRTKREDTDGHRSTG
ncbi:metalloregulator ArsR/SmtB family transcription factor [Cryptosporangium sp. NPDC048952]|uniref:metalloregulator ArsR/SmtB family transcription factor n=1 Tax=Cryptosporangium sp. NPDC048952 TaxID=3363961 RepID=UPI00371571B1